MKKILNKGWYLFKKYWIRILIASILMTGIIISLAEEVIPVLTNYDQLHAQYIDNELWEYYVTSAGAIMLLDITWLICIAKGILAPIITKETKLEEQKDKQNG